MTKSSRLEIFQEIVTDFHKNVKTKWSTTSDYVEKGQSWIKKIKNTYNDPTITSYAHDLLLSEIGHFNRISGANPVGSLEYDDLILIMKGGGVKGLAYVGALEVLQEHYKFTWYTGTSAGAIAAILLGSGHTVDELKTILSSKNFNDFKDASLLGAVWNLIKDKGCYKAETFSQWLEDLLAEKLQSPVAIKLMDLPQKTTVYASRRDKSALIFESFNEASMETNAAFAARCSMSIPFLFTPQTSEGLKVFDGGAQNNFPVKILLEKHPNSNFLGLYLGPETYKFRKNNIFKDLLSIWTESSDPETLRQYQEKIVVIDPHPISTINFNLSVEEKEFLIESGRLAAINFLHKRKIIDKDDYDYSSRRKDLNQIRQKLVRLKKKKKKVRITVFAAALLFLCVLLFF